MKGTQWVIKMPRLKCRCGCTLHYEFKGKARIIYDSEPSARPTSTLSTPYGDGYLAPADDDEERPPRAEDDSDG